MGDTPGGGAEDGQEDGQGSGSGGGSESGQQGQGAYGGGQGTYGSGNSRGPLTPAEQVAVLDAQLEQGTGEFDAMILEEQQQQRQAARENVPQTASNTATASGSSSGGGEYGGGRASTGSNSGSGGYGGGIGGTSGGGQIPQDTAKYPPPTDIPSGDDDDVVARQLREAAMREPDPAVREKLWDEYRKYKGIEQ